MYAADSVNITVSAGLVQNPPAGMTTASGGCPKVKSSLEPGVRVTRVKTHFNGKAVKSVNVMATTDGNIVTLLNVTAAGLPTTSGGTMSSIEGGNAGTS